MLWEKVEVEGEAECKAAGKVEDGTDGEEEAGVGVRKPDVLGVGGEKEQTVRNTDRHHHNRTSKQEKYRIPN